jgi:hypothetical protein
MFLLLKNLDRRWIFLAMFLAVALPILFELKFPEKPTGISAEVFRLIEDLPEGSKILMAWDYDPPSEGELGPMATSFIRHACEKKLQMYFIALWPVGPQMIDDSIRDVINADFPDLKYGEDYCNLGFKAGEEAVIKVVATNLRELFTTDSYGRAIDDLPMMSDVRSVQDFEMVINVSAGYPGTKEWVQLVATPYPDVKIVAGCTGVQAPLLYPYIPEQLPGLLAAIKGAAEYEKLVMDKYGRNIVMRNADGDPILNAEGETIIPGKYLEGQRRMGPQLIAHIVIILLIIVGNVIFFIERSREGRR